MDLRQLRAFREVAREGSFTRAARNLHYSQSTVTAQIKGLEEALGACLLLRRGSRAVELTDAGLLLRANADRILELVDATCRDIQAATGTRRPHAGLRAVSGLR
jgi:LysR family hydrogen peroxide-inducible transcriptional activator